MGSLRRLFYGVACCLAVLGVVVLGSCKNKCGSTTCQNGGTCESSKCVCPLGYSGNACQNSWSGIAVGTYLCSRSSCKPAVIDTSSWQSTVTTDPTNGGFTIDITNFDHANTVIVATIDSNINGVSLISVSPASGTNYGVTASGTYSNGIINLRFTSSGAGVSGYTCNMIMKKL